MLRLMLALVLALVLAGGVAAQTAPGAGPDAAPAQAAATGAATNAYSAKVPVAGTSDAQRDAAIADALAQVLQQVSPGVAATPDELAQASGYVRDFHYLRTASGNGLSLQVDFDPGAISRLVAANQAAAVATASSTAPTAGSTAPAASATGGSGDLWVDGIEGSSAFASLLSTLRGDADVRDVTPVAAEGNGVLLHMDFNRPLVTVLAGLTVAGGHLKVAATPHPGAAAALQWVP